ncbi:DUF2306 domain-containing protein [Myxococcus sp. CA040A]|uniref:DUF2306 domain-containing protein n=1 Tax=Myxococcus sp. CA040A TaxID=2741738 RepID=UPI00157A8F23|nr:DUF2306 domain-containing protein [Myxococcus sp. CA040A]NTX01552.1 DUF2306 domain-containing protein [Myxococcus sp. CA040A]
MSFYYLARAIHIMAGVVGFTSLWLPLVARKGSSLHRRVGWVYVVAMGVVAITGLIISSWRFLQGPEHQAHALFFMFLSVMSGSSASMGVRVLRTKSRTTAHRHPFDLGLSALTLGLGLFTGAWGLVNDVPLLWGFAPVGILQGAASLRYWLRPPQERMHWWFQHMGAMVGSGIATLTAVLVVNARHLGIEGMQLAVFLGPTLVGVPGLKLWERYYQGKFAAKSKSPRPDRAPPPAHAQHSRAASES